MIALLACLLACSQSEEDQEEAAMAAAIPHRLDHGRITLSGADRAAMGLVVTTARDGDVPDARIRFGTVSGTADTEAWVVAPLDGRLGTASVAFGADVASGAALLTVLPNVASGDAVGASGLGDELVALPLMGGRFLPEFHEGSLIAHVFAVPGSALAETTKRADEVARKGLGAPPAETHAAHVAARVGRAALDEDAAPVDRVEMDFRLPDDFSGEWGAAVADIAHQIGRVPGVGFVVEGFLGERIHEVLSGETAPIVVKVTGPDLDGVRALAGDALAIMGDVRGLGQVSVDPQIDVPQLRVRPRRDDLARAGVRASDVVGQMVRWRQGEPVAQAMSRDGRLVDVVVAGPLAMRDEAAVRDLPIRTATGAWWPLSSLADVDVVPAPASVAHDGGLVVVHIGADAPGAALTGAVSRLQRAFDEDLHVPAGYHVAIAGEAAERSGAATDLLIVGALVLGGVFALLSVAFGSSVDAGIVLLNLPLGLLGGVLAALLLPEGLSVSGFVGFVTLFGICARNGIMLVSHTKHLDAERPDLARRDRVLLAAEERLLPILMTAATAGLGLLPLALSGESAGSELESPMAVIVCGGLVTSTALNMLVLPTIYAWRAGNELAGGSVG